MEHEQHSQIMSTLAVICEKQDATEKHLAELNGKAVVAINGVVELQKDKATFVSSFKTAKKMTAGIITIIVLLIGTITSLALYAYQSDRKLQDDQNKELTIKTKEVADKADKVATDLSTYQSDTKDNWAEVIKQLKALNNKK